MRMRYSRGHADPESSARGFGFRLMFGYRCATCADGINAPTPHRWAAQLCAVYVELSVWRTAYIALTW